MIENAERFETTLQYGRICLSRAISTAKFGYDIVSGNTRGEPIANFQSETKTSARAYKKLHAAAVPFPVFIIRDNTFDERSDIVKRVPRTLPGEFNKLAPRNYKR